MKYIKNMREALKDPKKKALTQLGLYAIFFAFVFILVGLSNTVPSDVVVEEYKTPKKNYEDMVSYNYKIIYTSMDRIDVIEGAYYNSTSLFTYNNLRYYYEDYLYVINDNSYALSSIEYNIAKIFNKNLFTIFNELEEVSTTTYKNGMIMTDYKIDSNKIYNYLFDEGSTYSNTTNISITEKENVITSIVLDLTNLGLNLNKIEIEYTNIDNIENLNFNKNNYTYEASL